MADSLAKLRRLLNEAQERIRELESRPVEVVRENAAASPTVEVIRGRVVYQDNPEHIAMIRTLQDKLCQYTSQ